ncbi:mitochondrial cardiolipin hydrolase zuc isoform X2 [Calliopsis andreniformis]
MNKQKENIREVMFFTKELSECRWHSTYRNMSVTCPKDGCPVQHMKRLTNYLNRAKQTLDVCMYMLTCESLSKAIVDAHKQGILVRIIMDQRMVANDASQAIIFHNNGIVVRMQEGDELMHHKFVIVDGNILITGSTNWTMSAFFGNFDNILVTNEHSLVKPFMEEFEKLWKTFENSVLKEKEDTEYLSKYKRKSYM